MSAISIEHLVVLALGAVVALSVSLLVALTHADSPKPAVRLARSAERSRPSRSPPSAAR